MCIRGASWFCHLGQGIKMEGVGKWEEARRKEVVAWPGLILPSKYEPGSTFPSRAQTLPLLTPVPLTWSGVRT